MQHTSILATLTQKLMFQGQTRYHCVQLSSNLSGGQILRAEDAADWLSAVECFYGVGLVGVSTLLYFVPPIKGHDTGDTGMSPVYPCFTGNRNMCLR